MQMNRLFEIVYLLLDEKQHTAKELAGHFEVSTRTIYRDIEALSGAGIPVYMTQGKGGGIALLPNFVLNKAVLTDEEKQEIISSLESLQAVNAIQHDHTLRKLRALLGKFQKSWIEIDFDDWGNLMKDQFETSKQAILANRLLSFTYISVKGEYTKRVVEPVTLVFKSHTWYLKCFCLQKQQPRLFRLSRMRDVVCLDETFVPRHIEIPLINDSAAQFQIDLLVKIEGTQRYRIYDEFANQDIQMQKDGSFLVHMRMIEDEWMYGYLLSFGNSLTVLEPYHVRQILKKEIEKMLDKYDTSPSSQECVLDSREMERLEQIAINKE